MSCPVCPPARGRCFPSMHSPGGINKGTAPFRPGKTRRDRESGAWSRRFANREADKHRKRGRLA